MPCHTARVPVRAEQRSDEEDERPRGEQRGFEELPLEDRAGRDGHGEEKGGLSISKEVRVADDEIADEQQREKEGEEEEHEAFRKRRSEAWEFSDEPQPHVEHPVGEREIAGDKGERNDGEQPRLFAHGLEAPPEREGVHANEQEQRGGYGLRGCHARDSSPPD